MGIASIVLGILAVVFAAGGFMISFVPSVGAIPGALLTLTAPLLALIGIVLGGVGLSRAKSEGTETGLPTAGLIVSILAFFPAFFVAITCGLCDMMCASSMLSPSSSRSRDTTNPPYWMADAGLGGTGPGMGGQGYPPPVPPPIDPTTLPPGTLFPGAQRLPNGEPVPPIQPEALPPPPPILPPPPALPPEPPRPG